MINEIILGLLVIVTLVLLVMLFRFFKSGGIQLGDEKPAIHTPEKEPEEPPEPSNN